MVKLYKMDCDGNLYFCDYGLPHKVEDYKLRGYIVKQAIQPHQRVAIPQRGKIHVTHRMPRKVGFFERFVNDIKHNIQIFKEIGQMFVPKTRSIQSNQAKEYFATRALAAA